MALCCGDSGEEGTLGPWESASQRGGQGDAHPGLLPPARPSELPVLVPLSSTARTDPDGPA